MTETVKMNETRCLFEKIKRLQGSLLLSVNAFRKGDDSAALDFFRNGIEDLQDLLDYYVCMEEPCKMTYEALPAIRLLAQCIDNQDCIGIADTLEFTIYPLTNKWLEGHVGQ